MRVLLIGGHGFIGSAVARLWVREGRRLRCLVRTNSQTSRIDDLAVERALGDVRDLESLTRAMAGCDGIIHLASPSSWNDIASPSMHEVVVAGTRNVLAAAATVDRSRVVYVSSAAAINGSEAPFVHDEESPCTLALERFPYVRAKREAESLCRRAAGDGLRVTIVNPTEVYGPGDTDLITSGNLIDFVRSQPAIVCSGGTSVVHVEDVAQGVVAALEHGRPGERYILGGENLSIRDLARMTLEVAGKPVRTVSLPNPVLRLTVRVAARLGLRLPINPAVVPYATLYWYMSSAKAQRELGLKFRGARETLGDTLAWLRDTERLPGRSDKRVATSS